MLTIQPNVTGRKLPTRAVRARYGVCDRTIARWERDPDLKFPQRDPNIGLACFGIGITMPAQTRVSRPLCRTCTRSGNGHRREVPKREQETEAWLKATSH